MTYCHIESQIAQYTDCCDTDEPCPDCDADLNIQQLGKMWSKHCENCGYYEDNESDYEGY